MIVDFAISFSHSQQALGTHTCLVFMAFFLDIDLRVESLLTHIWHIPFLTIFPFFLFLSSMSHVSYSQQPYFLLYVGVSHPIFLLLDLGSLLQALSGPCSPVFSSCFLSLLSSPLYTGAHVHAFRSYIFVYTLLVWGG